jgi:hypothetical protein
MTSQTLNPSIVSALAEFEKSTTPSIWLSLDKKQTGAG